MALSNDEFWVLGPRIDTCLLPENGTFEYTVAVWRTLLKRLVEIKVEWKL
jgi:hypothetical protein